LTLAADQKPGDLGHSVTTYKYWHNRVAEISEAFDKSQPRDIGGWWMDRRNTVQWYTFWIAALALLLTVVFGLIQSITGIILAYAAYHKD
jgi:Ni/Fe-hydrogenase subunit HybB-like protein